MGFLEHLQSSLILGTALDQPLSKNFDLQRIDTFFNALKRNHSSEVFSLVQHGFPIDTPHYQTHETALLTALELGLESLSIELIHYGACIITPNKEGQTPLYLALTHKLQAVTELLINLHAFQKQDKAMQRECFDIILQEQSLAPLEVYAFFMPKLVFEENIFLAAKKGEVQQVIHYLHQGISIHTKNRNKKQSLLHIAIISGSIPLVSFLLNRGIDVDGKDKFGNFPLIYAALFKQRINILALLIKRNATLDQMNNSEHTALTMAIRKQNIPAIDLLCQAGANLNHRDGIHTPLSLLHDQIHHNHNSENINELRRLFTYFLIHGAHVDATGDTIGWTALQLSINYYDSPFYTAHITKLLSLGAQVNARDVVGRTALMLAAGLGRIQSLKILLDHGAYIDYEDKYGWTALMLAVYNNQIDIVKLLLQNGADINLITSKQLSALKVAIDQKNSLMETFLKDQGAVLDK